MSTLQFEEKNFKSQSALDAPATSKMVQIILKAGIAKTEKQAGNILMVMAILLLLLSFYIFFLNNLTPKKTLSPEQQQRVEERALRATQYRLNNAQ